MDLNLVDEKYYYNKPKIESQLQDRSCEYGALAMILYCFPDKVLTTVVKNEHPDFISPTYLVGLEVTEADSELHKQASKEFYKYKHPKDNQNTEKNIKTILKTGAKVMESSDHSLSILDFATYGDEMIVRNLKDRISKKESITYDKTNELYLAIVFSDMLGSDSLDVIKDTLFDSVNVENTKFKRVYIVTSRFCMMFLPENKSITTHDITRIEYNRIRTLGRMTAEGLVDINSKEWTG